MDKPYVVILGRSVQDEYWEAEHYPMAGEKISVYRREKVAGGFSNSAFVMAALGLTCYIAETFGAEDESTAMHQQLMHQQGIKTDLVRTKQGYQNHHCVILKTARSGERTIFSLEQPHQPVPYTESELALIGGADWLLVNLSDLRCFPHPQKMLDTVLRGGVKLAIDAEAASFESRQQDDFYFSRCSFLSLNEFAYQKFCGDSGHRAIQQLLQRAPNCIVAHTLGAQGSRIYTRDVALQVPALPVAAVDTTGAGDTYNGAFLYGLTNRWPLEKCALFATAAAARSTLYRDPRGGAVSAQVVQHFIAERRYAPVLKQISR